MSDNTPHPASYRDPKGHIFISGGEVYRTVTEAGAPDFDFVKETGLLDELIAEGLLVSADPAPAAIKKQVGDGAVHVLHHPKVPFISYPYEWSFQQLKDAALLHLDIQLKALKKGVTLSDATAYNIQFLGAKPVFIDHLSFEPYEDGQIWVAHKQFCDQFLNPLLLSAYRGVAFNHWYRGAMEGIDATQLSPLLPWKSRFSFNVLSHVHLLAKFQNSNTAQAGGKQESLKKARLSRLAFEGILNGLRKWIIKLNPKNSGPTEWGDYTRQTSYKAEETLKKEAFVRRFHEAVKPDVVWDTGANDGEFASIALEAGAKYAVGFEQDHTALEKAVARSKAGNLPFLPVFAELTNPSPSQGLAEIERDGMLGRAPADAVQALAVLHHLAIGRNVPLGRLVDWYLDLAPKGILEFVPKEDPMVKRLLTLREDIFPDYTVDHFRSLLAAKATIVEEEVLSASGRTIFWFEKA